MKLKYKKLSLEFPEKLNFNLFWTCVTIMCVAVVVAIVTLAK